MSSVLSVCAAASACKAGVADPAGVTCQYTWCLWLSRVSHALDSTEWHSAGKRCKNETIRDKAAGCRAPELGGFALARSLWP